jgi:hypothetical protein
MLFDELAAHISIAATAAQTYRANERSLILRIPSLLGLLRL